ncbi:MAG: glyoxalase [Pseudonocardiales bacterium]|nr:glyoxalase [Pseudonocardiales bacterium]
MTVRDTPWPAGTPCWVDLMTTDIDAATRFYEQLFGWQVTVGAPETGGYVMAEIDGRSVAGLGPMQPGMEHPPVWTTYLASDDVAATTDKISGAGGTVVQPPFDVLDIGVMCVAQDPTGGTFGVWQGKSHFGVQIANEPNTLSWNELLTRDYDAAKNFYASVFGYTYTELGDENFQYATIEVDGNTVGGIGSMPPDVPAQMPPHWRVYFAVDDTDAAIAKAVQLGGTVLRPAQDMPYGRWGDVADPQGAMFSLIKPASQE